MSGTESSTLPNTLRADITGVSLEEGLGSSIVGRVVKPGAHSARGLDESPSPPAVELVAKG
jgi:hypothetical protein